MPFHKVFPFAYSKSLELNRWMPHSTIQLTRFRVSKKENKNGDSMIRLRRFIVSESENESCNFSPAILGMKMACVFW
jgi:hypothetical protein